ncbi:ATP-binding protein [Streptomyces sp. NPDC091279]|uniref:ATP-binding protein n=1 Tax=unclassified Streptomyces TaxID=2593676 RepID=UPI003816C5F4
MSLPLTRRIARAALLVAAGAAAGVGVAGSASAATELPATPNLGGLTALDAAGVGNTVDGAAQKTTGLAGEAGGQAVKTAVPAAGKTGGKVAKQTTPAAQKAAGDAAGSAGSILGDTAQTATKGGLPTDTLTKGGGLPSTGQLPLGGLPLGG